MNPLIVLSYQATFFSQNISIKKVSTNLSILLTKAKAMLSRPKSHYFTLKTLPCGIKFKFLIMANKVWSLCTHHQESWLKLTLAGLTPGTLICGSQMGSENMHSSQIPGNADTAGPGSTLEELLPYLLRSLSNLASFPNTTHLLAYYASTTLITF